MNPSPLFRERAMEQISSPEQLDQTLRVTNPRGWLALGALFLLIVAIGIWSVAGEVPTLIPARGITLRPGGVFSVVARQDGVVSEMRVDAGDLVHRGQVVARIQKFSAQETGNPIIVDVRTPFDGRVTEVLVSHFDAVSPSTALLRLEQSTKIVGQSADLQAALFVDSSASARIHPGMEVEISPSNVPPQNYGFVKGTVLSVSAFPVSVQGVKSLLGDASLAEQLAGHGTATQVIVSLMKDSETPSGYAWTSPQGPPFTLRAGSLCNGNITLQSQRPIELVFPPSR